MEYRVTIEIAEYGLVPENGERWLAAFMDAHPEVGPVVSQNTETGALAVTYSFDAPAWDEVATRAAEIFAESTNAAGLSATQVLSCHLELVPDEVTVEEREPVLA
jgi:hypothetical protein